MVMSYDRLTDERKRSQLRLSDELIISPQKYENATYFHIEVPSSSRFFRIGYREYVFISLLDGETSFAHALAVTSQKLGADAITEQEATQTVSWLLENGLAHFAGNDTASNSGQCQKNKTTLLQKLNPFWLKIPLGEPHDAIKRIRPYFSWMFNPVVVACSAILIVVAILTLATNWRSFAVSSENVFSSSNWIWMLVTWVALKIVHEFAHAMVCNRFGGRVKETGIIFILFAPMAYVDVTSSWRFSSKWKRISVAGAGMYIELVIASLCVFVWCLTTSPLVAHHMFNVVFMASVSTLLFNANPLMRFDGYFILSDLLKIPNLYTTGAKSFSGQMRFLFFGQRIEKSRCELGHSRAIVGTYGICAAIWKVLICVGLAIAASVMFGGLGILLSVFGVVSWFGRPVMNLIKELFQRRNSRPHSLVRAAVVTGAIGLAYTTSWFLIPNPFLSRNPCMVDFSELSKIRAGSAGFVQEVFVTDGQVVKAGTPLLKLVNRELSAEAAELEAQLYLEIAREQIAIDLRHPAEAQVERQKQRATQERLDETKLRLNDLLITSSCAGRVVATQLSEKLGIYVNEGDVLLAVADENDKEIILSFTTKDVPSTSALLGKSIPIELGSRRRIFAQITRVSPRASLKLPHQSLSATNGGALVVKPVSQSKESDSSRDDQFELCEPRFHVVAEIDADTSRTLFSGERGYAVLSSSSPTLGQFVYCSVKGWLNQQRYQANQSQ